MGRVDRLAPLPWAQTLLSQHPRPPRFPHVAHPQPRNKHDPQHSPAPTQRMWRNLQIQTRKPSCTPKASWPQGSQGETDTWAEESYTWLKQLHGHTVAVLGRSVSLYEVTSPTPRFQQAGGEPWPTRAAATHSTQEWVFLWLLQLFSTSPGVQRST